MKTAELCYAEPCRITPARQVKYEKRRVRMADIKKIYAVYFSATGNTKKITERTAEKLAQLSGCEKETIDFTLPASREKTYEFKKGDLVVVGTPTYAGKTPNKMLPWLKSGLVGGEAFAVPVVTFGNRSFDNSLAELSAVLEADGFHTAAGGAFACRHAFTDKMADGRPDEADFADCDKLAEKAFEIIKGADGIPAPVKVDGDADAPYYVPKGTDGQPAKFLKATVQTDGEICVGCGACIKLCPMGSISPEDVTKITGPCIKCQACVRGCPTGAKYFSDAAFLSHVAMLEMNFTEKKENKLFF